MQVFYYSHIIGAAVFVVFGVQHDISIWYFVSAGLVVYGISVAYRLLQTSLPVAVDVCSDAQNNVMTIRIPVKVQWCTSHALCSSL